MVAACGGGEPLVLGPPAEGVYFGAKAGPHESDVATVEKLLGRKLAIRAIFVSWEEEWPDERVLADHRSGRLSLVTWTGTDLGAIASGQYSALIRERARAVRALGFPIFIRLMHEMNGDWFPWCCDPQQYLESWRRVHDIFSEQGATNVAWVWSPALSRRNWDAYYPGDDYVDWIGASVYNWGSSRPGYRWRPFTEIFEPFYENVSGRGKPLMLAEIGCAEQGGDKGAWLRAAFGALENRFPAVKAWIHQQYTDGQADWRVDSSPRSLEAYRRFASDGYFVAAARSAPATTNLASRSLPGQTKAPRERRRQWSIQLGDLSASSASTDGSDSKPG